jgi:hypothetical protein
MAKAAGLAASTVQGIWKSYGLAPHRWRQFKLSRDPAFAEKLHEVVGLYVAPPAHAVVLSIDEKSQACPREGGDPGSGPNPAGTTDEEGAWRDHCERLSLTVNVR